MEKNEGLSYFERVPLPDAQEIRNSLRIRRNLEHLQLRVDIVLREILHANEITKKYTFIVFEDTDNQVKHAKNNTIFIPTGLIKLTINNHELAFVIAHELAHWENEDIKDNSTHENLPPGLIIDSECNADEKGIHLLEKTQFKKEKALEFLKRIQNARISCLLDEEIK